VFVIIREGSAASRHTGCRGNSGKQSREAAQVPLNRTANAIGRAAGRIQI
jgi:hypothetical protein